MVPYSMRITLQNDSNVKATFFFYPLHVLLITKLFIGFIKVKIYIPNKILVHQCPNKFNRYNRPTDFFSKI